MVLSILLTDTVRHAERNTPTSLSLIMTSSNTSDELKVGCMEKMIAPAQCPLPIDERALIRKMDLKILPMLFLCYVAAFLDR